MKATIFLLWLLVCNASAETITRPNLIISNDTFTQDGSVAIKEIQNLSAVEVYKTETGVLNGVHYIFYHVDGSGTFSGALGNTGNIKEPIESNWSVACEKDQITDRKMCYMKMKDLWIYVYGNGKTRLSIGSEHFPGTSVTARVDKGELFTASSTNDGDFPTNTSVKIIERLKNAKLVTTRYMKWPYKSWIDQSWEIYGFNETYKYINWAVKRIK